MAKEIIAGISYSGPKARLVVCEVRPKETRLLYMHEFQNDSNSEFWYLKKVLSPETRLMRKVSKVSVAFDAGSIIYHSFPLDTSLTQSEQNGHIHWELSHIVPGKQAKDYIYDLHTLRISVMDQVADVLVVAIMRAKLFSLQSLLEGKKIELHIADTAFFGAEQALYAAFPEVKLKSVCLASLEPGDLSVGIFVNGKIVNFGHGDKPTAEGVVDLFRYLKQEEIVSELYLCGSLASQEIGLALRNALGVHVNMLNPFRSDITTSSCGELKLFNGREHCFASCVGVALRKR